jgi:hypothetical protein
MSRRRRIAVFAILLGLIGLELGLRIRRGPRVEVVVENRMGVTASALNLEAHGTSAPGGPLGDGGTMILEASASVPSPLVLSYRDEDDRAQSTEFPSFDGKRLRSEGLRFVIALEPNGVVSSYEEDDPSSYARFKQTLWLRTSITLPYPF